MRGNKQKGSCDGYGRSDDVITALSLLSIITERLAKETKNLQNYPISTEVSISPELLKLFYASGKWVTRLNSPQLRLVSDQETSSSSSETNT